jgi:hypothetical protein
MGAIATRVGGTARRSSFINILVSDEKGGWKTNQLGHDATMVATAETPHGGSVRLETARDPQETRRLVTQSGDYAFPDSDSDDDLEEGVVIKSRNSPGKWN